VSVCMVIIIYTISRKISEYYKWGGLGNLLQLLHRQTKEKVHACVIWIKIMFDIVPNLYLIVGELRLRSIIYKAFHIWGSLFKNKLLLETLKFLECYNLLLDPRWVFPEAK